MSKSLFQCWQDMSELFWLSMGLKLSTVNRNWKVKWQLTFWRGAWDRLSDWWILGKNLQKIVQWTFSVCGFNPWNSVNVHRQTHRKCPEITCLALPLIGSLLKVGGFVRVSLLVPGRSSLVGPDVMYYHSVPASLYDSNYLKGTKKFSREVWYYVIQGQSIYTTRSIVPYI